MNWQEAKQNTLEIWQSIHDAVGEAEKVDLLTEINAITDLCVVAKGEAHEHADLVQCHYCPAYQQFGGCREVTAELGEMVVKEEWDELRATIKDFMRQLQQMESPPEGEPTVQ